MRVWMTLACLALALTVGACGDSGDDDDGANSGGGAVSGRTASSGGEESGLGKARFTRIEAVLGSGVTLEDYSGSVDGLRDACEQLDKGDALLAALRRQCAVTIKLSRQLQKARACGAGSCSTFLKVAAAAKQQVEVSEAAADAIDGAGLSGSCASALKTSKGDLDYLRATEKSYTQLAKAREENSQDAEEDATELLIDAAEGTSTGGQQLERFRGGC